jgi:hypothetical protein
MEDDFTLTPIDLLNLEINQDEAIELIKKYEVQQQNEFSDNSYITKLDE